MPTYVIVVTEVTVVTVVTVLNVVIVVTKKGEKKYYQNKKFHQQKIRKKTLETQIMTKLKKSNCDNSTTQIVTKRKNSKGPLTP